MQTGLGALIPLVVLIACSAPPKPIERPPAVQIEAACDGCTEPDEAFPDAPRVDPDMATIPAGWFTMGCDEPDWECEVAERPSHQVWLPAYRIDRHEVTRARYLECVAAGVCQAPELDGDDCNASDGDRSDHPINCVTWFNAETYCTWRNKRLPTEAEWEKAARGTNGATFPWGDDTADCDRAIMHDGTQSGCGRESTWPVGSRPKGASPYGLQDMAGNVWEWVNDWYEAGYPVGAVEEPGGPATGSERVIRSGSWDDLWAAKAMRTMARSSNAPDTSGGHLGFRCATGD